MHSALKIISRLLSALLYPMFMPTYGMILFCISLARMNHLPLVAWLVCIGTTAILTIIIPITAILVRIRRGKVSDIYITDPQQRTIPYLYTLFSYAAWCYLLAGVLHAPGYLIATAIGASLALVAVMCINTRWKISAHLTGIGGLLGGVLGHYLFVGTGSLTLLLAIVLLALCLMYARINLRAHSPLQVIAGFIMGLCFTYIPCLLLSYAV